MHYHPLANEALLLQQLSESNEQAYATLYEHYVPLLTRQVRNTTPFSVNEIEDFIQDAFMNVWENRDVMCGVHSFSLYIVKSVRNLYKNRYNRLKRGKAIYDALEKKESTGINSTEDNYLYDFYRKTAMQAVEGLPAKQRAIFWLCSIEGMPRREAARQVGISEVAAKKLLSKGKVFVINHLRHHGEWLMLVLIQLF